MTTRRHFLGGLASSAALATGWREETPTTTPPPDRPRVVMLGLDGACSELMRSAVVPTPNYDRLVRESTRLARCYAVFPLCAPARAAFLTALPPQSHGQLNNHFVLHEEMPTAVGQLRDLGLSSYLYGKQHTNNDETEAGGNTWGYDAILTRNSESLGTVKARYEDTDARRGWLDEEDKAVFAEIEGLTGHDFGGRIRPFSADPDWAFLQAGLEQVETLEKQGGRWLVNISLLGSASPLLDARGVLLPLRPRRDRHQQHRQRGLAALGARAQPDGAPALGSARGPPLPTHHRASAGLRRLHGLDARPVPGPPGGARTPRYDPLRRKKYPSGEPRGAGSGVVG